MLGISLFDLLNLAGLQASRVQVSINSVSNVRNNRTGQGIQDASRHTPNLRVSDDAVMRHAKRICVRRHFSILSQNIKKHVNFRAGHWRLGTGWVIERLDMSTWNISVNSNTRHFLYVLYSYDIDIFQVFISAELLRRG